MSLMPLLRSMPHALPVSSAYLLPTLLRLLSFPVRFSLTAQAIALDISRVDPRLLVVRKRLPEEKFARDAARRSLSEITVDETFEVLIVDETKEDPIIEPVFDDAALTVEVEATIGEARERVAVHPLSLVHYYSLLLSHLRALISTSTSLRFTRGETFSTARSRLSSPPTTAPTSMMPSSPFRTRLIR